jgi:hypothetical protein
LARIRTIKPEFWTDDKVVQVSFPARLLFIGLWNFADDSGNLENSPVQIKMRILPADSVTVPQLLDELLGVGLLREYSVNGKNYFNIPGFTSHQVINKPSKTRLPRPTTTTPLPDGREGKGREVDSERKGKDSEGKGGERGGKPVDNSTGANDGGNAEGHPPVAPTPEVLKAQEKLIELRRAQGIPGDGRASPVRALK